MKPWIGVLVSLLVANACLVACGDSDDGPGVRNAALLTSDTTEVKVSSGDDSKEDSDYNDAVASVKLVCEGADNQISAVTVTLAPATGGAKNDLGLVIRLPKVDPGKIVEHNGNKVLAKTIYLTDESSSADLCENLESNSRAIVAENEAHLLATLESMKPKKDQLTKEALEDLLLPSTPPKLPKGAPDDSDADASDITAEIQLMVIAREGEPTAELIARQQAILTAIDICPSRIEVMRNSHPLGPFKLQVQVLYVGSASAPSKCGLGLEGRGELDAVNGRDDMSLVAWGETCRHPHGSIRIPEGSTCTAAGFE
tara:strand:+ start:2078 stop:3016 length:939 start_codon:yes stop_codon:yes gene_type:complete